MSYCGQCGTRLPHDEDARFCPKCGVPIANPEASRTTQPSPTLEGQIQSHELVKRVETQPRWTAKLALLCYLAIVGGTFAGSLFADLVLLVMRIDMLDPPFPIYLLAAPINQVIFFAVTLSFARYKGAGLKELGLKKANVKVLTVASLAALPLVALPLPVYILQEMIFGPDPLAQLVAEAATPRNSLQLVALVAISLALVGPCEELAFRGFIQKGFENSLGKRKGLLIASGLFALSHGLNTLYPVLPVFVGALCLGYAWQRTDGNTTVSALIHGVYDSIIFAAAYILSP